MLLALLGATAGQGVVWYTGQFYALFYLTITLKLDYVSAYSLIALSLLIGTPFFIVFGWLSDRIGRLKIILAGCLIAALTFFPLFKGLTHYVNPDLEAFAEKNPITVSADQSTCNFHIFVGPWSNFTQCDRAQDFLDQVGLSFKIVSVPRVEVGRHDHRIDQGRGLGQCQMDGGAQDRRLFAHSRRRPPKKPRSTGSWPS